VAREHAYVPSILPGRARTRRAETAARGAQALVFTVLAWVTYAIIEGPGRGGAPRGSSAFSPLTVVASSVARPAGVTRGGGRIPDRTCASTSVLLLAAGRRSIRGELAFIGALAGFLFLDTLYCRRARVLGGEGGLLTSCRGRLSPLRSPAVLAGWSPSAAKIRSPLSRCWCRALHRRDRCCCLAVADRDHLAGDLGVV